MIKTKLHADEPDIGINLVARLIAGQFPAWRQLPLRRIGSGGTDNAIYRLGDGLAVRLPLRGSAAETSRQHELLRQLAPRLPLAIPEALGLGAPDHGYPYAWSIHRWIAGQDALIAPLADLDVAARQLASFVTALKAVDLDGSLLPGQCSRGAPLRERDAAVRQAIDELAGLVDGAAVTSAWERALNAGLWRGGPLWLHGDIHPGNLIVAGGEVAAVIDFSCCGVGDPASDLQVAWTLLDARSRDVFRRHAAVDDATWLRGQGWALSVALIALPYYLDTNPAIVRTSRRAIREVLSELA